MKRSKIGPKSQCCGLQIKNDLQSALNLALFETSTSICLLLVLIMSLLQIRSRSRLVLLVLFVCCFFWLAARCCRLLERSPAIILIP